MGRVPQVVSHKQVTLRMDIPSCWYDHCFQGRAVLPAVEAVQHLAASVLSHVPDAQVMSMQEASFEKFFLLNGIDSNIFQALHELHVYEDGRVASALISRTQAGKAQYTRTKRHVRLCFGPRELQLPPPAALPAKATDCYRIDSGRVYSELVPFREAYHNLRGEIRLSPSGVQAEVYAPPGKTKSGPLGSPFPLDAAFHAACVWCQRYSGIVAFPVGFHSRTLYHPTKEGETYSALIRPQQVKENDMVFDIWLQGKDGEIYEAVSGVRMRDVSAGRMRPPAWVREGVQD